MEIWRMVLRALLLFLGIGVVIGLWKRFSIKMVVLAFFYTSIILFLNGGDIHPRELGIAYQILGIIGIVLSLLLFGLSFFWKTQQKDKE